MIVIGNLEKVILSPGRPGLFDFTICFVVYTKTMRKRQETAKDFISCFIILSRIDSIYLRLDDFLKIYVDYLQNKSESEKFLIFKINHLLEFIVNFHKLKIIPKKSSLESYKHLLKLKLSIIGSLEEKKVIKKVVKKTKAKKSPDKIRKNEKNILDFIKSKGRIQNKDIFNHFKQLHPRSIKRNISNLVKKDLVKREAEGKAVFYWTE